MDIFALNRGDKISQADIEAWADISFNDDPAGYYNAQSRCKEHLEKSFRAIGRIWHVAIDGQGLKILSKEEQLREVPKLAKLSIKILDREIDAIEGVRLEEVSTEERERNRKLMIAAKWRKAQVEKANTEIVKYSKLMPWRQTN